MHVVHDDGQHWWLYLQWSYALTVHVVSSCVETSTARHASSVGSGFGKIIKPVDSASRTHKGSVCKVADCSRSLASLLSTLVDHSHECSPVIVHVTNVVIVGLRADPILQHFAPS